MMVTECSVLSSTILTSKMQESGLIKEQTVEKLDLIILNSDLYCLSDGTAGAALVISLTCWMKHAG